MKETRILKRREGEGMGQGRKEEERTAARVELRSALGTSYVERDDLGAEEVIPAGMSAGMRTSILPQQAFRSLVPQLSPAPCPVMPGDQSSLKILNQPAEPSAVEESATLDR